MHYADINASYIRNNEELENHTFLRILKLHFQNS